MQDCLGLGLRLGLGIGLGLGPGPGLGLGLGPGLGVPSDIGLHGHARELAQGTVDVDQLDKGVVLPAAPRRPASPPVAYDERHARGELGVGLLAPMAVLA